MFFDIVNIFNVELRKIAPLDRNVKEKPQERSDWVWKKCLFAGASVRGPAKLPRSIWDRRAPRCLRNDGYAVHNRGSFGFRNVGYSRIRFRGSRTHHKFYRGKALNIESLHGVLERNFAHEVKRGRIDTFSAIVLSNVCCSVFDIDSVTFYRIPSFVNYNLISLN